MKSWKTTCAMIMTLTLALALAGSAFAFGVKELDNEKLVVNFHNEVGRGGYKVVDTETLKKWADDNKPMLIIDTMPLEASYEKQHIPGAVQIEFPIPEMTQLDQAKQAEFEKLLGADKAKLLVFYCGFPKCTRSHNGAMWAVKLGYANVYRHPGGIKAWDEAGYPVQSGK
jgi:rhodanese-related sulfurtransferase